MHHDDSLFFKFIFSWIAKLRNKSGKQVPYRVNFNIPKHEI
ncbi:hypothetical protein HMPREF9442_01828 [Paraprevotella xylaniphila YIT 11841]|uniref:Uncharacterized protein n=1 Tax=Paraprevotella xylaniphila YIT 11841 TaxID=762982 RepID=F3QUF8_9BACT|nr:hypothetical protein HMPREF9442_01828 [Paraprevotella xylaniphila YIT 11841]